MAKLNTPDKIRNLSETLKRERSKEREASCKYQRELFVDDLPWGELHKCGVLLQELGAPDECWRGLCKPPDHEPSWYYTKDTYGPEIKFYKPTQEGIFAFVRYGNRPWKMTYAYQYQFYIIISGFSYEKDLYQINEENILTMVRQYLDSKIAKTRIATMRWKQLSHLSDPPEEE
jgi:hypothetical protein